MSPKSQLLASYVLSAALMIAYAVVFTLLAEIRGNFGFSESAIGLIAASAFAAGFFAQLGLSPLADAGHGGALLRAGLAVSVVGMLWMVVASELWEWLASRALLGFGAGIVRPALRRYVMVLDPARAGSLLGTMAGVETAGFLIGPIIGSVLFALWGLRAPFMAITALLLLLTPMVWWMQIPASQHRTPRAVRTLLVRPAMQSALAMGIAFYIAVGVFEAVWAVYMADLGASQMFIGITLSIFTLPMIVIAPWGGALAQRSHVLNLMTVTLTVAMACMLGYGVVNSLWWLCVPLAVHAIVDAITMPAVQLAVGYASGEGALAAGQGLFGATGMAVATAASIASGVLYEHGGAFGLWSAAALTMLVFIIAGRLIGRRVAVLSGQSTAAPDA